MRNPAVTERANRRPLIAAGTMIGIGMGGFVDGIVFHQILQLHNMLSAKLPPTTVVNIEINMVWDGLFHAFTWITTAIGIAMLWSAVRRRDVALQTMTFLGSLILGWGVFNLVEGVIDHHILQIHHVYELGNHLIWDLVFLGSGLFFVIIGWMMIARSGNTARPLDSTLART
jgi:uncharacterized membrane protein